VTTHGLSKYLAFARIARRQALRERTETYGRAVLFAVFLAVFSALWRAVSESGMPIRAEPETLVWYLAVTEWIVLGVPAVFVGIEEDVKRGDIAYRLPRPVSYLASVLAEGVGQLSVRMPILGVAGFGLAWLFTGRLPEDPLGLLWAVPLVLFATFVLMVFYAILGLMTFWVGEVGPFYWVFQKLLFVLGGLMLPLDLYPDAVLEVASFTPFPRLLYGPGSLVLGHGNVLELGAWLFLWLVVGLTTAAVLFKRARRSLELNGG
jgi:ABC-2 type transport system permease protein